MSKYPKSFQIIIGYYFTAILTVYLSGDRNQGNL